MRPKPQSEFQRSETEDSEALPRCSDELRKISFTSWGESEGSACSIAATIPEAIGVAMLVPSFSSYSFEASGRPGWPGNEDPVWAVADIIPEP